MGYGPHLFSTRLTAGVYVCSYEMTFPDVVI